MDSWCFAFQHHNLSNGHKRRKKFEDHVSFEVKLNFWSSSRKYTDISACTDFLRVVQFIAGLQKVSSKTVQKCFPHCDFKHSRVEMPNTADIRNISHWRLQFSFTNSSVGCFNENRHCQELVVEKIAVKCQKIRKLIRMTPAWRSEGSNTFSHLLTGIHWWDCFPSKQETLWYGMILMLWELVLPCSLCFLLGVCVQDHVEMVEISGALEGLLLYF